VGAVAEGPDRGRAREEAAHLWEAALEGRPFADPVLQSCDHGLPWRLQHHRLAEHRQYGNQITQAKLPCWVKRVAAQRPAFEGRETKGKVQWAALNPSNPNSGQIRTHE
jgi:hypothetical protein